MRGGWYGGCLKMALAVGFGASLAMAGNDVSAAAQRQINQVNPDLDTDDQLAPSQMKQPVPRDRPRAWAGHRGPGARRRGGSGGGWGEGAHSRLVCLPTLANYNANR